MPLEDRFGLALSTKDAAAVADYVAAVDLMLSANAGAEALFDRALAADPEFALAHIAKARLCQVQARIPEAKAEAAAARGLARRVSPREARHIEIVALAIDGNGPRAMALLEEHVAKYPRDGLALSLALGVFGLLGFSGRIDHHEAQLTLLERLAPHWGEDWWFLAYLGWARIELGDITRGAAEVERALAGNPRNAFAAHARAHGYYEAGDEARGAAFIEGWLPDYSRDGQLHGHISWHLALFELARDNADRARALYLDAIRPAMSAAPPLFNLADAASFLWRWQLYEAGDARDFWPEVAAHARQHFPQAGIHFADVHAALAEGATGDRDAGDQRVGSKPRPPRFRTPAARCGRAGPVRRRRGLCRRRLPRGGRTARCRHGRSTAHRRQPRAARGVRRYLHRRLPACRRARQGRGAVEGAARPPTLGARRTLARRGARRLTRVP